MARSGKRLSRVRGVLAPSNVPLDSDDDDVGSKMGQGQGGNSLEDSENMPEMTLDEGECNVVVDKRLNVAI